MKKSTRFLYLHKVVIFNLLFFGFVMLFPPHFFDFAGNDPVFHYYAGVGILTALFFEFAAIWYKSRFIYSQKGAKEKQIPFLFRLSIWPRLLISAFLLGLAFRAMGWLTNDFVLLVLAFYAAIKEFWVRKRLLDPESAELARDPDYKVWLGEAMFFLFACVAYVAFWEYYLLETPGILLKAKYPQNYPFVAGVFLLFLVSILMPYLLEEALREKKKSQKTLAWLSFIFPTGAMIFQLFKLGYLDA